MTRIHSGESLQKCWSEQPALRLSETASKVQWTVSCSTCCFPGSGVPWVRFEADTTEDSVTDERTFIDYVHWDDFAHSPERTWADVERRGWVARRISMTRAEGKARFKAASSPTSS